MTMPSPPNRQGAELLCVGTELLLGNILNSNARWLAERLAALGVPHYRQVVVGDNRERVIQAVRAASGRAVRLFIPIVAISITDCCAAA